MNCPICEKRIETYAPGESYTTLDGVRYHPTCVCATCHGEGAIEVNAARTLATLFRRASDKAEAVRARVVHSVDKRTLLHASLDYAMTANVLDTVSATTWERCPNPDCLAVTEIERTREGADSFEERVERATEAFLNAWDGDSHHATQRAIAAALRAAGVTP